MLNIVIYVMAAVVIVLLFSATTCHTRCVSWCMGEYPHLRNDFGESQRFLYESIYRNDTPYEIKKLYCIGNMCGVIGTILVSIIIVLLGYPLGYIFIILAVGTAIVIIVKFR